MAIANGYMEDIYTYIWHMTNHDVVLWNEYSIKVPHELVAKKKGDKKNEEVIIFSAKIPKEIYVQFSKTGPIPKRNIDLKRKYIEIGLRIIEINDSIVLGEQRTTIKSNEINNPEKYFEQVYLRSSDTMNLFIGKKERRNILDEIIQNMQQIQTKNRPPENNMLPNCILSHCKYTEK